MTDTDAIYVLLFCMWITQLAQLIGLVTIYLAITRRKR